MLRILCVVHYIYCMHLQMYIWFSIFHVFPKSVVELPGYNLLRVKIVAQVGLQFLVESSTCWLTQQPRGCQRPLRRVWAPASRHWQDAHVLRLNDRRQLHHAHLVHFRGQGVATVSRIARMTVFVTLPCGNLVLLHVLYMCWPCIMQAYLAQDSWPIANTYMWKLDQRWSRSLLRARGVFQRRSSCPNLIWKAREASKPWKN